MTERIDITIIGAGVVGLAVAAAVTREKRSVCVLERRDSFGRETSSRNSEVIHAGIYYPPETLKAAGCVEGNRLLYEICGKYGIRHKRIGKIIVACDAAETAALENLYRNGIRNGVQLAILDRRQIQEMEPHIGGIRGIYSPDTGIVDSHGLMKHFASRAAGNGAQIVYGAEVTGVEHKRDGYSVTVRDSSAEDVSLQTRIIINCAGLESDWMAWLAGIDIEKAGYALKLCKGVYFKVADSKAKMISRLVYPVPDRSHGVLGTHASLDVGGKLKLGPDAEYIKRSEMNYDVDAGRRDVFYQSVKNFLPFIEAEDLSPDMAGVRPKLHGPREKFRDFVIEHEDGRGLPGLVNLVGIESPGLTASPWIGRRVARIVDEIIHNL
jgi:L-2-hydroxyglutarate oxidase LhgO